MRKNNYKFITTIQIGAVYSIFFIFTEPRIVHSIAVTIKFMQLFGKLSPICICIFNHGIIVCQAWSCVWV